MCERVLNTLQTLKIAYRHNTMKTAVGKVQPAAANDESATGLAASSYIDMDEYDGVILHLEERNSSNNSINNLQLCAM